MWSGDGTDIGDGVGVGDGKVEARKRFAGVGVVGLVADSFAVPVKGSSTVSDPSTRCAYILSSGVPHTREVVESEAAILNVAVTSAAASRLRKEGALGLCMEMPPDVYLPALPLGQVAPLVARLPSDVS
jgi:hypothetical protein